MFKFLVYKCVLDIGIKLIRFRGRGFEYNLDMIIIWIRIIEKRDCK